VRRLLALPLLAAGAAVICAGVGLCVLAALVDPEAFEL
jgi:hypothetical protein